MEVGRVSLLNCVPSFAQGSDILVVHSDTLCLGHLSVLLRQCSFKVTATNQASAAIDIVCQQEGRFKLVMAKANMPDMNTISFLNTLLLKHITVIFICSGQDDGGAKEAFDRGYCYLLQEPIKSEHLISLWQQVYNSNNSNLAQEIHSAKSKQKKFKSEVRRLQDKCKSSNFRDGTKSSSSIQSQCHPGYPTSAALQDHFPVSFSGTEDLEAVVRGAVSDRLMDTNQHDDFGNGFTEDDSSQNSEIQTNPIFRNSSSPQKSNSSKHWCAKPSAILRELEPCASMNQSEILTEDKNIFRILGGDSEGYDCFSRGPDHITQNYEIQSSCIHGYSTLDSCNPSPAFLGGHELTDQNTTLTEHDSVLRFVEEADDCFGKGLCSQNCEMLRNSVLGYNFGQLKSDNYNPSCDRLLKSKVDALNSKMLRNAVSGNSSSSPQSDTYNC
ncbi:hypothetical protein K1719_029664 [Acacia pycnantha]|nr:hypothetical protein K1719_029664 [Acacia pycnantha]